MGEELTRQYERTDGDVKSGNKPAERAAESAGDRSSRAAESGGSRGAGAGAGTAAEEKTTRTSVLAVDDKQQPPAIPSPDKSGKKKPAKKKPKKKPVKEPSFNASQISALLVSISTIAAAREGMEMWALSEVEAEQLAAPIANIIEKNEKLAAMSEHTDAIALMTACFVIFVPRFMMWSEMQKAKKQIKKEGVKIVRSETESNNDNRGNSGKPAASAKTNGDSIFAAIPSLL